MQVTVDTFAGLIDGCGEITLEKYADGGIIKAPAETVVQAINEGWPGRWAEYAACWQANGYFVAPEPEPVAETQVDEPVVE